MLLFVGLGLWDHTDISVKGLLAVRAADHVMLEGYTSRLMGSGLSEMEAFFRRPVLLLDRHQVEDDPQEILSRAKEGTVVFLTAGDPMVSTTHADLRLRAHALGIPTALIHGASIATAACGLSGLQNYRFGKSCSLPFPEGRWHPKTPLGVIRENLARDLHTLVYLDIREDRFMSVPEAVTLLDAMAREEGIPIPLYVGIARAGSPDPVVKAGRGDQLMESPFGGPLHILAVPATLHPVEEEYLVAFAGLATSEENTGR